MPCNRLWLRLCNLKFVAERLRDRNKVEIDLMQRSLGKQFKFANKIGAKQVVIVGPDELKEGKVKVKDMESGKEELIDFSKMLFL